jgi:hypothetical protein
MLVNRGPHALYRGGAASGVLKRLGVKVRGSAPPLAGSSVLSEGHLHLLRADLVARNAPWLGRRDLAQLAGWVAARGLRREPDRRLAGTSATEWLASHELRPHAHVVAEALVRVTSYCSDLTSVSADAIAHQLAIGLYPGVRYLDGGWNQLVASLCELIGEVRQARVESVLDSPGGYVVQTNDGSFAGRALVVAVESEAAARRLLYGLRPAGEPVVPATVSCLDLVVTRRPSPRFILGLDEPVYLSLHSPPADLAAPAATGCARPDGRYVVQLMRYGARTPDVDRPLLEHVARLAGLDPSAAAAHRYLADMTVISAVPSPTRGGLAGRPPVAVIEMPGCFLAGDWVGPDGMLADTSFASGECAGLAAAGCALAPSGNPGTARRRGATAAASG